MNERRVVNTSPLIYLSRAGLMNVLRTDTGPVIVPQYVSDEIFAWRTADAAQQAIKSLAWLEIVSSEAIIDPCWPGILDWANQRY